ncbi:MAG TPA: hypothetical protein VN017_05280 [Pseudoxanthomonas sp.]|nr:hypothetical protein [Pseudoxanthomonas sp.]
MKATIVPTEPWHITIIAENARQADIDELWCSSRSRPDWCMRRGLNATVKPYTGMVDGKPVCMFGVSPFSILSGMGAAWMIGSKELNRLSVQKELLRLSRPVVASMRDQFPALLYNFVDQRNTSAIRWLRWLGFQFDDPIPYGVDGLPFLPFYLRGE